MRVGLGNLIPENPNSKPDTTRSFYMGDFWDRIIYQSDSIGTKLAIITQSVLFLEL